MNDMPMEVCTMERQQVQLKQFCGLYDICQHLQTSFGQDGILTWPSPQL